MTELDAEDVSQVRIEFWRSLGRGIKGKYTETILAANTPYSGSERREYWTDKKNRYPLKELNELSEEWGYGY